jgi:hypothetical protein
MGTLIIPVLLSLLLGPGVGQLYNREFRKGSILILLSLVILLGSGIWYVHALRPYIPPDLITADPQAMQEILRKASSQIGAKDLGGIWASQGVLMLLWLYGVLDAYLGAQKRRRSSGTTNP